MDNLLSAEILTQGSKLFHELDSQLAVTIEELRDDPVFQPIHNLLFIQAPQPTILGVVYKVPVLKSNAATEKIRAFSPKFTGGCNFVGVYSANGKLTGFWGIQPVNNPERATAFLVSRTQPAQLVTDLMKSRTGRGIFQTRSGEKFLDFPGQIEFSALSQSAGSKRVSVIVVGLEGRDWLPMVLPRQLRSVES